MRRWKPQRTGRLWVAIGLLAVTALGAIALFMLVGLALVRSPEQWPINLGLYLQLLGGLALALVAGMLAYRVAAALTLAYGVDRNGFYIFWLGNRVVVPLAQIESIDSGPGAIAGVGGLLRSVAYFYGQASLPEGKLIHRFATLPPGQALVLHTAGESYMISPDQADSFVQELEQRRRLGAIQQLSAGVEVGRMFFYAFWEDQVVRTALVVSIGLSLALLGWLAAIYPGLPALIDLRADAAGVAAGLAPRHQILFLPLAAVAILLINAAFGLSLYARTAVGARLLQIASAFVQLLFGVAVLTIVR